ncbi:MAG: ATP-binding cassette domain-containing protein [Cellulosilyticaceae bacterium]
MKEEYVLRTNNLTKIYTNKEVVGRVNMTIRKGEIYGLIGRNGAGKTTCMRMMTGLVLPTTGNIELFGEDTPFGLSESRKRIGALIEKPAFYPYLTAQENMEIVRIQRGIPGKESMQQKLDLVGLKETDKKVEDFSLGMKQKLGIAMALLGDPEFLILDEPTNGLDPVGIVEMRELFKQLNQEKGITILISTHILEELGQLATCYGIIHEGRLLQEITQKELDERCKRALEIKVDNVSKAIWVFENILETLHYKVLPDETIKLYEYLEVPEKVAKALVREDVLLKQLVLTGDHLEDYFLDLIGGVQND